MTEPEQRPTEGDEHERVWNADTDDVLDFLASLDRLSSWMGLPADDELDAEAYDDARTHAREDDQ